MTKKFKFLFGTLVLALGFFFCCSMVSVSADEVAPETQEPKVEETTPEETQAQEDEETDKVDSFLSHLKDLKWEEAEAIIGWVVAYLVANFGVIAFCVIKLILNKLNETKQSKAFQDALAKLSIEHQEKVNEFMNKLDEKLLAVNEADKKFIEEQKATIEKLTNDSTVQIANELKQVTELLK